MAGEDAMKEIQKYAPDPLVETADARAWICDEFERHGLKPPKR